jgi:hypothetical protein
MKNELKEAIAQTLTGVEKESLLVRAIAAYHRSGARAWLSEKRCGVREIGGKTYVVLGDRAGCLTIVYRLLNSGQLKRLKRWPKELES